MNSERKQENDVINASSSSRHAERSDSLDSFSPPVTIGYARRVVISISFCWLINTFELIRERRFCVRPILSSNTLNVMVCEMGDKWQYNYYFVNCHFLDLSKTARRIFV